MKYILFLFLFCAYGLSYSLAQNIGYIHLSSKHGLSGDLVNCLWQDKQGLMWIGTNNGLNLYDGYHFTVFKTRPSLDITSLKEDEAQQLWIGTKKGLSKLSLQDHSINAIQAPADSPDLTESLFVLFCDSQKGIWVLTESKRIYRYDSQRDSWQYIVSLPPQLRRVANIYEEKATKEIHILVERQEKHLYHLPTGKLKTLPITSRMAFAKQNKQDVEVYYQFEQPADATGEAFDIQTNYELDVWVGKDTLIRKFKGSSLLASIVMRYQDMLWFSTQTGLAQYDMAQRKVVHHYSLGENPVLKGYIFGDFLMDKGGALWIATNGNGLLIYAPQKMGEMSLLRNLRGRSVRTTFMDREGQLWAGAYTTKENFGLSVLDKTTQREKHFIKLTQMPHVLAPDGILPDAYLWVAMQKYGGIAQINQKTFQIEKKWDNLPVREIWSLASDKKGGLWLIAYKGQETLACLVHFEIQTGKLAYFSAPDEDFKTLYLAADGQVWVGSAQGNVYQFTPSTERFERVLQIPQTLVRSLTTDKQGNVWIATLGAGLWKYNLQNKTTQTFTEKEGLPSNTLYAVQADRQGDIWVGTLKGIAHYSHTTQNFSNFKPEDGLQNNEFNANASYFCDSQNSMVFGGIDGINVFNPDKLRQDSYVPPIVLTDILRMGKPIAWRGKQLFALPIHEAQMIEFQFSALSYYHSQHNQYQYKIDGLTADWVDLGTKNSLLLSNLGAGKYVLRVKGSNHHGVWSKEELRFEIVIVPPFWQTWWFYSAVVVAILTSIIGYFYQRSKAIQKRNVWLEQEVQLRTQEIVEKTEEILVQNETLEALNKSKDRFFAIIAHDLRSPLVSFQGISKQINFFLKRNEHEKVKDLGEKIDRTAQNLTNMLNNLLNWALLQKGEFGFNPEMLNLHTLTAESIATFQPTAITHSVDIVNEISPETPVWADRSMLQTIIHNLVSNALKFTPTGGKISLSTQKNEKGLTLVCADTGLGIPTEKIATIFRVEARKNSKGLHGEKGNGIGLPLCFEFAKAHQGSLHLISEVGKGTTVSLSLPFEQRLRYQK
jgi:signal transduction histidine kinase/ligand-binding sensor domain-containing protein